MSTAAAGLLVCLLLLTMAPLHEAQELLLVFGRKLLSNAGGGGSEQTVQVSSDDEKLKKGEQGGYVRMKSPLNHKRQAVVVFHGKQVRNCMPKGFRHASAPSRYVNYHTLGSSFRCRPITGRRGSSHSGKN